jgi:hypothetical protein
MEQTGDEAPLIARAEWVLREQAGTDVRLREPAVIDRRGRSLVLRCATSDWDGPASVVVKRYLGDDQRAFTDWATLLFLSSQPETATIAPRFYAGDPVERLMIMEDLGGSHNLEHLLAHGASDDVASGLRALAAPMARLVATTVGREDEFLHLRASLPGAPGPGRDEEARRWLAGLEHAGRWAEVLAVALPDGFTRAAEDVAETYAEPGMFLALSHGDPAPSNTHLKGVRARLLDFEYAAYRHALYDLTGWYVLCPLPYRWVIQLEQTFRRTLMVGPTRQLVADEQAYQAAWAAMCAYRGLAMLSWFPLELLEQDGSWVSTWSRREALLSTMLRLHSGSASIAPLATFGKAMADALRARWPELGDGAIQWPALNR